MTKGIQRGLCAVLVLIFALALGDMAQGEGSRGILYKTQKGGVTVYLLGSIHVGSGEMYPFGETISQAMEEADTFVFECDTTSPAALSETLERMVYSDGTSLGDVLPEELYQKLTEAVKKLGLPMRSFSIMRPWAVMTQLAMHVTAAEMGVQSAQEAVSLGVESRVKAFADEKGKALGYLETVAGQLNAFDSMSGPLQEYLLDEAVTVILEPEKIRGMDATITQWPGWWRDGNMDAFISSYQDNYLDSALAEPEAGLLREYHEVLLCRRNETMADTVDAYLQGDAPHTYFVTVGLLHLILPEDSIVGRLQERGYTVECLSIP